MITIMSRDEQRKAVVTESKNGYPMLVEYYRRTGSVGGDRWIYDRCATVDRPLHLVLDTTHAVVNAR